MKRKFILIAMVLLSIFCITTFAEEGYQPVPAKEMTMPEVNQPSVSELNKISDDLNPEKDMGYTGKESMEVATVHSNYLNPIEPVYSYQAPLSRIYSQSADCNILAYDYSHKKWEVIYKDFSQKGYEPYKIVVSPDENFIGIVMAPDGGRGFYLKVLDIKSNKLKNIGTIDSIGWFFFTKDSKAFVIIEKFGGKIQQIQLND